MAFKFIFVIALLQLLFSRSFAEQIVIDKQTTLSKYFNQANNSRIQYYIEGSEIKKFDPLDTTFPFDFVKKQNDKGLWLLYIDYTQQSNSEKFVYKYPAELKNKTLEVFTLRYMNGGDKDTDKKLKCGLTVGLSHRPPDLDCTKKDSNALGLRLSDPEAWQGAVWKNLGDPSKVLIQVYLYYI